MRLRELKNKIWRDWLRPILLVAIVLGSFRSAVADWNDVPTGSMKPTILAGERIFIYRAAYDLRVPFTTWSVWRRGEPERGDIVVLISPHDGKRLVKRVVGLPGDHVALHSNRLVVNGRPVRYETHGTVSGSPDESGGSVFEEKLPGRAHAILLHEAPGPLSFNAVSSLTSSGNKAVIYFVKRDLLGRKASPLREIWDLPEVRKLLARQQHDGRWRWTGSRPALFPPHHHDLIETFERFRELVMYYELSRAHPAIERAAEFLFSCQTDSGDIRGMLGNQHATYYTGEILALLIKAGYAVDARVEKGMRWLRAIRQDDGGWNTPLLTHRLSRAEQYRLTSTDAQPLPPDRTRPSQGATYAERLTRPTVLVVFRVCHS